MFSALNLYGIFFSLIFGCRLNKDDYSFLFIIKAELNCPFGKLKWFITPLFGLMGIIFFYVNINVYLFISQTASKIPTIKKFLEYLHLKPKYWHSLNFYR